MASLECCRILCNPFRRLLAHFSLRKFQTALWAAPSDVRNLVIFLSTVPDSVKVEGDIVKYYVAVLSTVWTLMAPSLSCPFQERFFNRAFSLVGWRGNVYHFGVVEGSSTRFGKRPRITFGARRQRPAVALVAEHILCRRRRQPTGTVTPDDSQHAAGKRLLQHGVAAVP